LAREVVREGIRVNAMAPGVIDTPIHAAHASNTVTGKDDLQAKLKKSIPMGRLGRPDECAGVLLFLASDELSSYVTGQTIGVNGGSTMA
jgi:3-oxoacyl-[acyl-carrier protein] reductase